MGGRKDICGARRGTSFEAKNWLSLDVCGVIGVTTSFLVHVFAFTIIVCYLISDSLIATAIFLLLYMPVFVLALASLFMAWTSEPGCVPMGARPLVSVKRASSAAHNGHTDSVESVKNNRPCRALRRCPKCNDNFKPTRAHHDSVTGRCIVKFDHFCPWIGNAVGAMNHKFFILFVGYTMLSCLFSFSLIGLRTFNCGFPSPILSGEKETTEECTDWNESYLGLALLVVSLVFFFFTSCMFAEQIEAIKTNTSKIARMKMSVGHAGTELARVTEEFNEMFGVDSNQNNAIAIHWFIPTPIEFPNGMKKVVLGYDWDETFDATPYQESNNENTEIETPDDLTCSRIELTSVFATTSSNVDQTIDKRDHYSKSVFKSSDQLKLVKRNSRDCMEMINSGD